MCYVSIYLIIHFMGSVTGRRPVMRKIKRMLASTQKIADGDRAEKPDDPVREPSISGREHIRWM